MTTKAGPRSNPWQPQISKPGRFVFPKSYSGDFDIDSDFSGLGVAKLTITSGLNPMIESFTALGVGGFRQYVQDPKGFNLSNVVFAYSANFADCTQTGTLNVQLPLDTIRLQVTSFSKYTLTLNVSAAVIPTTVTCAGPPATTSDLPFVWPGGLTYIHSAGVNNLTPGGNYLKGSITDTWAQVYESGGHADIFVFFSPSAK